MNLRRFIKSDNVYYGGGTFKDWSQKWPGQEINNSLIPQLWLIKVISSHNLYSQQCRSMDSQFKKDFKDKISAKYNRSQWHKKHLYLYLQDLRYSRRFQRTTTFLTTMRCSEPIWNDQDNPFQTIREPIRNYSLKLDMVDLSQYVRISQYLINLADCDLYLHQTRCVFSNQTI